MNNQLLDMSIIRIDGDTQPRTAINPGIVQEYAEAMQAGAEFPAVTVVHDGAAYWLVDGFHRFFAHQRLNRQQIKAEVIAGELKDARWLSVAANKTHGLRRTNEDKAKAVVRALRLRPDLSNPAIAEHVGVSEGMVRCYRVVLEKQKATAEAGSKNTNLPASGSGSKNTNLPASGSGSKNTNLPASGSGSKNTNLPVRLGRDGKRYPGHVARNAHQTSGGGTAPRPAIVIGMSPDPAIGARALIKLFDANYLRALVMHLTNHLEQIPEANQSATT